VTRRNQKAAYVLGSMLLLAFPDAIVACTQICGVGEKVSDREWTEALRGELESRPIIFLGRVTQVGSEPLEPDAYAAKVATLEVIREWKGTGQASYRMTTGWGDADCGYPFEVGQVHLLFIQDDRDWMSSSGCPEPTRAEIRATIRKLDKLSGRKKLAPPRELR
jgi:hypothetical protein